MSTFAQSLNYLDLKRKSVGARNYRVNISPRNGGIHNASGNVQLQLPTIARSYADLSQAYIKLKLRTAGTAGFLDKNAYSLATPRGALTRGKARSAANRHKAGTAAQARG